MKFGGPEVKLSHDPSTAKDAIPQSQGISGHDDMDLALLADSLAKTPWERMQANDDALRLMDLLRQAMQERQPKRHAKP